MSNLGDTKKERRILSLSSKSALMRMFFAVPAILSSYKVKLPRSVDVIPNDDAAPDRMALRLKVTFPILITPVPFEWKRSA